MSFVATTEELIGLGTQFEMETIRRLRMLEDSKEALDYLSEKYDSLLGRDSISFHSKLLTRHVNRIGYWYFDFNEKERRFVPEDQIDIEKYWRRIRNYYMGAFFGKDKGSLITVVDTLFYDGESYMRPAIWRYVTGRELLKNDLERLGIYEET